MVTAKQFLKAFKTLSKAERDAILRTLAADRAVREDLLDMATIARRRTERSRPFRDYLAERRSK